MGAGDGLVGTVLAGGASGVGGGKTGAGSMGGASIGGRGGKAGFTSGGFGTGGIAGVSPVGSGGNGGGTMPPAGTVEFVVFGGCTPLAGGRGMFKGGAGAAAGITASVTGGIGSGGATCLGAGVVGAGFQAADCSIIGIAGGGTCDSLGVERMNPTQIPASVPPASVAIATPRHHRLRSASLIGHPP